MWSLRTWAAASNDRAIVNARTATTACSRRRVEREEVAMFLASLDATPAPGHPAWAATRSH